MASLQKLTEGQTVDYINIESENQKSGLIILLVLFHSAYPYKNYCLKCFTELQTLFIYLFNFFFFFYLVCNFFLGGGANGWNFRLLQIALALSQPSLPSLVYPLKPGSFMKLFTKTHLSATR